MKGLLFLFAAAVACICLFAAPLTAQAGGCHNVAVVQSFAVAQPVVVQQAVAVQAFAVPVVYQQQFVQAQAVAVAAPVVYSQNFVQAKAFGGFSSAQAIASGGGFGNRSIAASFSGPRQPIANGLALLAAARAARRGGSFSIAAQGR